MADLRDLQPIVADTVDTIRARVDADTNLGVPTTDPGYVDTVPGGPYYTLSQGPVLEIARLRDLISWEYVAAALLPYAYGDYLDAWGETLDLPRKDETSAAGVVTFTAPNGTVIAGNTEVAVSSTDPDADEVIFRTTAGGTVAALATPTGFSATAQIGGGSLAAGTYYYKVSAKVGTGETIASAEVSATLSATGRIQLAWGAVPGAAAYRVFRGNSTGAEALLADDVQTNAYIDAGGSPAGATPPVANTTGGAWALPVIADVAGAGNNAAASAVSLLLTANPPVTAVTNPYRIGGGADVETDEFYRDRLLDEFKRGRTGSGTIADYERWARDYAGVGYASVEANWSGAGTVRVTVTDSNNDPVSSALVTALQNYLDPTPGQGLGLAPIGAIVTVTTPASVNITVAATISHLAGYTIEGAGATIATRPGITAAVKAYVDGLKPGDDVLLNRVEAAILSVDGVYNVSGVTLNGGGSDVAISAVQVSQLVVPVTLA